MENKTKLGVVIGTQNAIDLNLPVTVDNGGTGQITLPANTLLTGNGTSPVTSLSLQAGQIAMGDINGNAMGGILTAGSGVTIGFNGNGLVISSTAAGFAWVDVTNTNQDIAVKTGYLSDAGSGQTVLFSLPTVANVGDTFEITTASSLWAINQNENQIIRFGNQITTLGVNGGLTATQLGDTVKIVCTVANTNFQVVSAIGNIQLN